MSKWKEIRNDFYDEEKDYVLIDAWETEDADEEGKVIAIVYADKVVYEDEVAKVDSYAQEIIEESKEMIKKAVSGVVCPLCGNFMKPTVFNSTHIYSCRVCPGVLFEYSLDFDYKNLGRYLEIK